MSDTMAILVISYARTDRELVRDVVRLLRSAHRNVEGAVYWDEDFEPGEEWYKQFQKAVDGADQLFVFWCMHSASSRQVRREFMYALSRRKTIVPVLLDDTHLPRRLSRIHGLDIRRSVRHRLSAKDRALATNRWKALSRRGALAFLAIVGVGLSIAGILHVRASGVDLTVLLFLGIFVASAVLVYGFFVALVIKLVLLGREWLPRARGAIGDSAAVVESFRVYVK